MLTLNSIGQAIKVALRDSAAILAECDTLFERPHVVFYGASGQETGGPEYFPLFTVVPWGKERGEDEDRRLFTFSLFLELEDTTITDATTGDQVLTREYRGVGSLEDLLDLALAEILNISPDLFLEGVSFSFNPIEFFPVMVGEISLTISFPVLIGGFEPTV
jgi:hypothetical protein